MQRTDLVSFAGTLTLNLHNLSVEMQISQKNYIWAHFYCGNTTLMCGK